MLKMQHVCPDAPMYSTYDAKGQVYHSNLFETIVYNAPSAQGYLVADVDPCKIG